MRFVLHVTCVAISGAPKRAPCARAAPGAGQPDGPCRPCTTGRRPGGAAGAAARGARRVGSVSSSSSSTSRWRAAAGPSSSARSELSVGPSNAPARHAAGCSAAGGVTRSRRAPGRGVTHAKERMRSASTLEKPAHQASVAPGALCHRRRGRGIRAPAGVPAWRAAAAEDAVQALELAGAQRAEDDQQQLQRPGLVLGRAQLLQDGLPAAPPLRRPPRPRGRAPARRTACGALCGSARGGPLP